MRGCGGIIFSCATQHTIKADLSAHSSGFKSKLRSIASPPVITAALIASISRPPPLSVLVDVRVCERSPSLRVASWERGVEVKEQPLTASDL